MDSDKKRARYDRKFKIYAVNMIVNGGRSVNEVLSDLGIDPNILHRWI
jgi:transposase-like protein